MSSAGAHAAAEWMSRGGHADDVQLCRQLRDVRGARPFRNRDADGEGSLADMVHQTAMYYEDRLNGGGFGQVLLAGGGTPSGIGGPAADDLRATLELRLGTHVDTIDPRGAAALTDRITADTELLDALAPLVGLLARERAA